MSYPAYEVLQVSRPADHVVNVQLNRPEKSNAMDHAFIRCVLYACVGGRGRSGEGEQLVGREGEQLVWGRGGGVGRVSSLWHHVLVWEHTLCTERTRGLLRWQ